MKVRNWLYANARETTDGGESLGLMIFGRGRRSIPRNVRTHRVSRCIRSARAAEWGRTGSSVPTSSPRSFSDSPATSTRRCRSKSTTWRGQYWAFTPTEAEWPKSPTCPLAARLLVPRRLHPDHRPGIGTDSLLHQQIGQDRGRLAPQAAARIRKDRETSVGGRHLLRYAGS